VSRFSPGFLCITGDASFASPPRENKLSPSGFLGAKRISRVLCRDLRSYFISLLYWTSHGKLVIMNSIFILHAVILRWHVFKNATVNLFSTTNWKCYSYLLVHRYLRILIVRLNKTIFYCCNIILLPVKWSLNNYVQHNFTKPLLDKMFYSNVVLHFLHILMFQSFVHYTLLWKIIKKNDGRSALFFVTLYSDISFIKKSRRKLNGKK